MMRHLDHQLLASAERVFFRGASKDAPVKVLVAFSGGVDSASLLCGLAKIKFLQLALCYVHHGDSENKEFRDAALDLATETAQKHRLPLFIEKVQMPLRTEEEMREARYLALKKAAQEFQAEVVALGHHADDLLETRMMRLIRGVGAQGFVGMGEVYQQLWRPLLSVSKAHLCDYAEKENIRFLEDPSNQDLDPLRNWLRQSWLPQLEERIPGSLTSLARSLENLVGRDSEEDHLLAKHRELHPEGAGVALSFLLALSLKSRRTLLAQYLYSLNKRDFSQGHLDEVIKRLDNTEKVHTFKVAGCVWSVNAGRVIVLD